MGIWTELGELGEEEEHRRGVKVARGKTGIEIEVPITDARIGRPSRFP
jgi:hypothetical protein